MPDLAQAALLIALVLAGCVWVGGYVAIAVVARTAATTLDTGQRVEFFRSLGRAYLRVGVPALAVALAAGAALLAEHEWGVMLVLTVGVAVVLLGVLAVAVAQARRMTRLRRVALDAPRDELPAAQVRHGARAATALRATIGVLSLALVVLGCLLATVAA